ncbi:MAG: TIGR02530 family flagellar biosynthesis protein [Myxococcota bacterium]|nr:TIGR02530 family flagellar biosynthesis protein [Myxococcota bacterium]
MDLDSLYTQLVRGPGQARPADPLARPPSSDAFAGELDRLLQGESEAAKAPQTEPVKLSRHAAARLESRGIELGEEDLERVGKAIDQLAGKGARESLVLLDDTALIVGVPKRTVITAMPRDEAVGNLFTGIDSAVVAA